MSSGHWRVVLGDGWRKYVSSRLPHDITVIGVVTKGAQFGALGALPNGRYVQINWAWHTPLPTKAISQAIYEARMGIGQGAAKNPRSHESAHAQRDGFLRRDNRMEVRVRDSRKLLAPAIPEMPVVVRKRRIGVAPPQSPDALLVAE